MSAGSALDPQARALLDQLAAAGMPPVEAMTVRQAREAGWGYIGLQGPPPEVASVEHRFIPGPTADLPVRIYTPEGEGPFPAIVWFHAAGWVHLNIEIFDPTVRGLARDTGCVVVAVNYQKAPEHRFPVAFDDAWASTCWVVEHAAELGIDPARIAVGGESSGGQLAASVALQARDEGGPALAYQLLIYPKHRPRPRQAVRNRVRGGLPAAARGDALVLGALSGQPGRRQGPARLPAAGRRPVGTPAGAGRHRRVRSAARRRLTGVLDGATRLHEEIATEVRTALHERVGDRGELIPDPE